MAVSGSRLVVFRLLRGKAGVNDNWVDLCLGKIDFNSSNDFIDSY
jgi:hypothetical protein